MLRTLPGCCNNIRVSLARALFVQASRPAACKSFSLFACVRWLCRVSFSCNALDTECPLGPSAATRKMHVPSHPCARVYLPSGGVAAPQPRVVCSPYSSVWHPLPSRDLNIAPAATTGYGPSRRSRTSSLQQGFCVDTKKDFEDSERKRLASVWARFAEALLPHSDLDAAGVTPKQLGHLFLDKSPATLRRHLCGWRGSESVWAGAQETRN